VHDTKPIATNRPFTVGQNWIMLNTPRGAQSSAILYSIAETARPTIWSRMSISVFYWTRLQNIFMAGSMIQMTARS